MSSTNATKSWLKSLTRYVKAPWKITGPCASLEYKSSVPRAPEYCPFFPATITHEAIIPSADTVFDIKYFPRD
ncbi:hypothetical protein BVRB_5g125760 [Beta vulgaris subsp. vulgaris]|uniref:Uncharacterized protein n=1 Tax=Beta vulgaris subsp. vulgaris TaxID=3555 RepID=A0A0J8BCC2_BETVV|nr:hypothetical protein BVRB_5g125760 [Beta vulgaris subsp. vulgaris]